MKHTLSLTLIWLTVWHAHRIPFAAEPASTSDRASAGASYNVRDYGASGDGQTLDSPAINKAFEACAAAGGGRVLLPPGKYLSGTIRLKSHITLWLDAGATLLGSTNLDHYESFAPPAGTPEAKFGSRWHRALLLGDGLDDVTLAGKGLIDGNKVFDPRGEERMRGPHTILLGNTRQLTLEDLRIKDSANYAILLERCEQVQVRNLRITGGWDGVHFRGWSGRPCRNVTITGCQFYTGDDSIAGRYWENVMISDCLFNSSCNGFRLIGPASHLIIAHCLFYGPGVEPHRSSGRFNMLAGINLQPGAWDATEGNLDDVLISDVTMHNVTTPFHFVLKPGNTAGRITVNRVSATGAYRAAASVESWSTTPFTNVVFRDVSVEYTGGVSINSPAVKPPGVDARPLPAWGFYARNIQNLTFENVRLSCLSNDSRPCLLADSIAQLTLNSFRFTGMTNSTNACVLTNVAEVTSSESTFPAPDQR